MPSPNPVSKRNRTNPKKKLFNRTHKKATVLQPLFSFIFPKGIDMSVFRVYSGIEKTAVNDIKTVSNLRLFFYLYFFTAVAVGKFDIWKYIF